jgi:hypothetical protein
MNFDEFIIDNEDYKFFESLPKDEKLLFIYDLICDESYGIGSVEPEAVEDCDLLEAEGEAESDDKFRNIISNNINNFIEVNIIILNNKLIVNSNSEDALNAAIEDMVFSGMVMCRIPMNNRYTFIFQHQQYCRIYLILGKEDAICKN